MKKLLLALLGIIYYSQAALAAITLVNHTNAVNNSTAVPNLAAPALSVTTGNLLVVFCRAGGGTTLAISDTASNTFTAVGAIVNGSGLGIGNLFYAKNVTGNASDIVTCTFSSNQQFDGITVVQYSGVDTTAPFDATAVGNPVAATTASTGTFTTTNANEIAVVGYSANSLSTTYTAGTGYALEDNNIAFGGIEDQTFGSIQTGVTASVSSTSHNWVIIVGTFIAAGGGGGSSCPVGQLATTGAGC